MSKKWAWKIFLPGFITGVVLQLNWAQGLLYQHGLYACITTHWLRILLSGIILGLLFYGFVRFVFDKNEKLRNVFPWISFFSCFYVLLFYLFFPPSDKLLYILLLLVPIVFATFEYFKSIYKAEGFRSVVYTYLLVLVFLLYKEILLIIYTGRTNIYLHYATIFSAPLLFLIVPLVLPRLTKAYAIVLGIVYYIAAFVSNSHIILYKAEIPPSAYYAIWETTITESTDFIKQYLSVPIIGLNILLWIFILLVIARIKRPYFQIAIKDRLVLVSMIFLFNILSNSFPQNLPNKFVDSYLHFKAELSRFRDSFEFRKKNPLSKQADINCSDSTLTFVLVIGESASKYHQGLYGYGRNTNPFLTTIKDELYIFDSVISPHTHTNPALAKVLSFANFESMEPLYQKRSIIEYFKDAGFKTFWFSNQQFASEYNTLSTMIGIQADEYYFTNVNYIDSAGSKPIYDEALLGPFHKALIQNYPKKFIVLHLMGSHSDKSKRYPESFNRFTDTTGIPYHPYNRDWVYYVTNIHDNSVLYNDYVLYQSINLLRKMHNPSIWLYFSDHGEEIFDYRDFWGHAEGSASIYMMDIPFIVWFSDEYKQLHPQKGNEISGYTHRKYQTDDVIHS
ncbi:MAG TPA: sulfatase-like hydrolase/transferase, partial [Bacteroidales bacterium]|nr:sulfatase-like hydrolase/transferase [Bacteroidales bacterium]